MLQGSYAGVTWSIALNELPGLPSLDLVLTSSVCLGYSNALAVPNKSPGGKPLCEQVVTLRASSQTGQTTWLLDQAAHRHDYRQRCSDHQSHLGAALAVTEMIAVAVSAASSSEPRSRWPIISPSAQCCPSQ